MLVAAFRDGKIPTRGRCYSWFGHDTKVEFGNYTWDRADVLWQENKYAIPKDGPGRRVHVFSDVDVHREGLERWINGAADDPQRGPQEPAEGPVPEEPADKPATLPERAEEWLEAMERLRETQNISWRKAAEKIAASVGVDWTTVDREARRIRQERVEAGEKSGEK